MKILRIAMLLFLPLSIVLADNDPYIIKQKGFFTLMPVYQAWDRGDNNDISQFTIPFYGYWPAGRNLGVTLRAARARASGENLQDLEGFGDLQLGLSYNLEKANAVFSLGVNLPTGQAKLSNEEFLTSTWLSLAYFNFQVPNFGQGWNVSPGVSWAAPLNEQLVIGLGLSYLYRGRYKPLESMAADYDPGDELLLTGGFDVRINPTATFTADVLFNTYGKDKLDDEEVYDSGNKIILSAQFSKYFGLNQLTVLTRYRSKGRNTLVAGGVSIEEDGITTPNQFELFAQYRMSFSPRFSLGVSGEGNFYRETVAFPSLNIFGFGVSPEMTLSGRVKIPAIIKVYTGSMKGGENISGFQGGIGLIVSY